MSKPQRALIAIDVQQEYFHGPLAIQYPPRDAALTAICRGIDAAITAGIPVALVQHVNPAGSVVFADGSPSHELHPGIAAYRGLPRFTKRRASVFTSEELTAWLQEHQVDTVTLAGFMANNCLLATAAAAETLEFAVEILRDASGTINLANCSGAVTARQLHETLMVLLHSNWATVTTTDNWTTALTKRQALTKSNLVASALGRNAKSWVDAGLSTLSLHLKHKGSSS